MIDALVGKTVGGYTVEDIVGRGGMATVYLARQISMNRVVAIKFLPRQHLQDDTYLQRFAREAKIVTNLEHRHIVPIYEYGEYEGQPYIVMRYMPGGCVDDLLDKKPLELRQILNIMQQVGAALDYAHSKNVLHRDLKPGNILMDESGGAYLTDFGIARFQDGTSLSITTQGVVGTPSYMSPEQARGKKLDGRSDIYALGIVLFEMATGQRPFDGDSAYDIAYKQVTESPPTPRSINPALTTAVETVILKALLKKPEDRYSTAQALLDDLKLAVERPSAFVETERNLKHYLEQKRRELAQQDDTSPAMVHPTFRNVKSSQRKPASSEPAPRSVPASAYLAPESSGVSAPVPVYTGHSQHIPIQKPNRAPHPLIAMILGGMLGCGLLSAVVVGAFIIGTEMVNRQVPADYVTADFDIATLPNVNLRETLIVPDANTEQPNPTTAALNATSQTAYQTLIPQLNADNDATRTAIAENPPTTLPTRTPAVQAAVSIATTPTFIPGANDITGTLVYAMRRDTGDGFSFEIMTLDLATGMETPLTNDTSDNTFPVASPDGRWIAFQSDRDGDSDIYVMNSAGGDALQLTNNDFTDRLPSWSPDGQWIAYSSDVRGDGNYDVYRVRLDGSDNQAVFSNERRNSHARYSPDGTKLVFTSGSASDSTTWELILLDLTTLQQVNLTSNAQRDSSPIFNPDGTRILYITVTNNDRAIAIMDMDGRNKRVLYDSPGSDWSATYSPDGRTIVFTSSASGEDKIYLMNSDGSNVQLIRAENAVYPSYVE
ncbi:MAG: protein kinase domain-containing protein [Aggregatilineales bacterium]